jgi:Skp family chaperone for outer membrane proteins
VIFLELAAQGIRGVAPAGGRATLRPGYNVVAAEGAVLRRVVEALLYPDPKDGDALPRAPGGPAGAPMRAGLTVVGNDRITYRLVRDFATGAQLHRFDPEKRSFALVSQDLGEIAAFMQRTVGVPPPRRLAALLALAAADLPSKAGGVGAAVAPAAPQRATLSPEQTKKRLASLRLELERAKVAEKLQVQLDGLQTKLFKLEEALKGRAKLEEGLRTAEAGRAELEGAAAVAARLGDPEAKVAAFEKTSARREEATAKVLAERETLAEVEARGAPAHFWLDPLFWTGAGGGLGVALVGAIGAAVYPDLRYLALLDVPLFGWAAWVALRWVGSLEEWERVARRRRTVDDWERKVEGQFDRDAAEIREAVKALGVSKPAELKEALVRVADADAVVAEWRRRLDEWQASPEARGALAERARVEESLRAVEQKLAAEAGGFVRDVRSVEAELQRLEAEAAAPAPAPPPSPAAAPRPAAVGDPLRNLLERAAAELGGSPAAAVRTVAQKASQTLSGLSFQRLQAVLADDRGNLQVQAGGRPVAVATLPPADRDLVFLALKLAFVEQALAGGKLVAVAEDAFGGLSEGSRRFAARLLKQIAKPGQIVHATSDPSFKEAADHSA